MIALKHKPFFDLQIAHFDKNTIIDYIEDCIQDGQKSILLPLNADCFNISRRNARYHELLSSGKYPVYPDGAGIIMGLKLLGQKTQERIVTTDLVLYLLNRIKERKRSYTIGFLGGSDNIAERARHHLSSKHGINNIRVSIEPDFIGLADLEEPSSSKIQEIIRRINESGVDILFLGLGCPKQELFAHAVLDQICSKVLIPCGGLFNYYAQEHKRAPSWMRNHGLEWLFRLSLEPRRLWKRYLIGNTLFLWRLFVHRSRLRHR